LHNLAFGNVVVHSENGKFVVTIHRRSFRLSGNDLKHHLRGSFRHRHITRQGKEGVVMISDEEYERLVGKAHQPKSLLQFFRESPLVGVELDLERQKDEGRDLAHSRAADKSDPQYYARLTVTKAVAEIRTHSASIPNTSEAGNHRDRN
jgi:hypothetical protein